MIIPKHLDHNLLTADCADLTGDRIIGGMVDV